MSENKIDQEENFQKKTTITKLTFWNVFWVAIILFFIVELVFKYNANEVVNEKKNQHEIVTKKFVSYLEKTFLNNIPDEVKKKITENKNVIENIENIIDNNIDNAFKNVYTQIPEFVDFHYSVKGEYLQLAAIVSENGGKYIKEKLFDSVDFDQRFKESMKSIDKESNQIIMNAIEELNKDILEELDFSVYEENLVTDALTLSIENTAARFNDNNYNLSRAAGVGVGFAGGLALASSKLVAKAVGKKVAAKVVIKAGGKLAAAGAGASAGATGGLLCGPGAPICSTLTGLIGAAVGWFTADKVIVEIDEKVNREEFEKEIKDLIDAQKQDLKNIFKKANRNNLNIVETEHQETMKQTVREIIHENQ